MLLIVGQYLNWSCQTHDVDQIVQSPFLNGTVYSMGQSMACSSVFGMSNNFSPIVETRDSLSTLSLPAKSDISFPSQCTANVVVGLKDSRTIHNLKYCDNCCVAKYMVDFEAVELPQNIDASTEFFKELTFY